MKSRYWSLEEAEVVVGAWLESGEGLTAFAERHGLGRERLRRWKRRLEGSGVPVFHPVRVVESAEAEERGCEPGVELVMRGGRRVVVPPGFDPDHLRRVVSVVEGWPC